MTDATVWWPPSMHRTVALIAALILSLCLPLSAPQPARAQDRWSDLTRRIAASQPLWPRNVALGTVPAGFAYPLNARPKLPVLGSTWFIVFPGGEPQGVRVYYAPTPGTAGAVEALVAKLTAAGYTHVTQSGFPNAFVGEYGPVQTWCPAGHNGPSIAINTEDVDGVAALDIQFYSYSGSGSCSSGALEGRDAGSPVPALGGIPGLTVYARMRSTETREDSLGSLAVIRTALPAAAAVAKLAERFTAKGWTARAPVVDGATTLQHFSRDEPSRRWNALLLFEPRIGSAELYDAVLDVTTEPVGPGTR